MNNKKILWFGGLPAAYMNKLHNMLELDEEIDIRFIFVPFDKKNTIERGYESINIGKKTVIVNKSNLRESINLIRKFAQKKDNIIIFAGIYPRVILKTLFTIRNTECQKLLYSDYNISDYLNDSFFYRNVKSIIFNLFSGFLIIGKANALYFKSIIQRKQWESKKFYNFPIVHFPGDYSVDRDYSKNENVRFLYLGRLVEQKNVEAIIDAAYILIKKGVNEFNIEIAGGGKCLTSLKMKVSENRLQRNINFSETIKSSETREVYRRNDVFILPSENEPWGLVVNEALSSGMPVITPFWVGAALDLIVDDFNGKIIFNNDAFSISEAMEKYIKNKKLLNDHSKNTKNFVLAAKKTAEDCHNTLKHIINNSN